MYNKLPTHRFQLILLASSREHSISLFKTFFNSNNNHTNQVNKFIPLPKLINFLSKY